jgi:DNA-binding PadR family transcriptional regulator
MAIKRGLQLPEAMLKVLAAADGASITQTAKALKISTDRASELMYALQKYGLVRVENQRAGGRGRPRKVATLSDSGRLILKLLQGELGGLAIGERELRLLLQQAREWCKRCRSTQPLGPACLAVASYAHLLGMDWECGVPIFSCQRWPKRAKSWVELVRKREVL